MINLLTKARLGRLAALDSRSDIAFVRNVVERRMVRDTVVSFQSRRTLVA